MQKILIADDDDHFSKKLIPEILKQGLDVDIAEAFTLAKSQFYFEDSFREAVELLR